MRSEIPFGEDPEVSASWCDEPAGVVLSPKVLSRDARVFRERPRGAACSVSRTSARALSVQARRAEGHSGVSRVGRSMVIDGRLFELVQSDAAVDVKGLAGYVAGGGGG